jgi:uncharacterized membrane protein YgcG
MRPSLRLVLAACLALLLLPAASSAQSKAAQGSTLAEPADYGYGCETRWLPAIAPPGEFEPLYVGGTTCSLFNTGTTIDDTHLVPGTGKITSARVRSGANPAPVSIMVARQYTGRDPDNPATSTTTCCLGLHESAVVQPTPNAVTEIPLDGLIVEVQPFDPQANRVGFHDVVIVNVHGPGSLPIADLGTHPGFAPKSLPSMSQAFPKSEKGSNTPFGFQAPGFEVLMNYSWCPNTGTRQACGKAGPVDGGGGGGAGGGAGGGGGGTGGATGGGGGGDQPPAARPAASISSRRLALKGKTVAVKVACGKAVACRSTVRLRTKARKSVLLGTKRKTVGAGRSTTVKVPLSAKNRRRIGRKGLKVAVEVDLGGGVVVRRTMQLRR